MKTIILKQKVKLPPGQHQALDGDSKSRDGQLHSNPIMPWLHNEGWMPCVMKPGSNEC